MELFSTLDNFIGFGALLKFIVDGSLVPRVKRRYAMDCSSFVPSDLPLLLECPGTKGGGGGGGARGVVFVSD